MGLVRQVAVLLGVMAAVTVAALALGAGTLGLALTFGQIAFAVSLVVLLLRG